MNWIKNRWIQSILVATILIASLTASYILHKAATQPTLEKLQTFEELRSWGINIRDKRNTLWWMEQRTGYVDNRYYPIDMRIYDLKENPNSILNKTYGMHFVNPYNNTIWLVVTDVSDEGVQSIEAEIGLHEGVKLIYRMAPASWNILKEYEEVIIGQIPSLKEKGVKIAIGISENATILIDIFPFTPTSVKELILRLPHVPLNLLVIQEGGDVIKE